MNKCQCQIDGDDGKLGPGEINQDFRFYSEGDVVRIIDINFDTLNTGSPEDQLVVFGVTSKLAWTDYFTTFIAGSDSSIGADWVFLSKIKLGNRAVAMLALFRERKTSGSHI